MTQFVSSYPSDCAVEQVVNYGETYYIHLKNIEGPITLEFRYSQRECETDREQDVH